MIRQLIAFAAFSFVALPSSTPAEAADPISLVGTWRVTSYSTVTVDTKEVSHPFGDKPIGYIQYSPGGHVVVFLERGDPEEPDKLPYSDAERVKFFNYLFGAYAGTYTVEANKITHHVIAAWRPDWVNHDQIRYAEIDGNKLTITTAPVIASFSGKQVVGTLTFERVE
jgi:hypothetical protein